MTILTLPNVQKTCPFVSFKGEKGFMPAKKEQKKEPRC